MDTLSNPTNFINRRNGEPYKHARMTTAAFKTDTSGNITIDTDHDTRQEAAAALPEHPIKIPGRWSISVSAVTTVGEGTRFLPGQNYNVDKATKEDIEKQKKLLVATQV